MALGALAAIASCAPAAAGEIVPIVRGTHQLVVPFEIGPDGELEGEVVLTFEEPLVTLEADSLLLSAVPVDPDDRSRLRDGTFVPDRFPVLLRIRPNPARPFTFRGAATVEVHTEELRFETGVPLRVFRAEDGEGFFDDLTETAGFGSYRAKATTGQMSDWILLGDLRHHREVVDGPGEGAKLARLQEAIDLVPHAPTRAALQASFDVAVAAYRAGDYRGARRELRDVFLPIVLGGAGETIPDVWDSRLEIASLAGILRGLVQTTLLSITLEEREVEEPPLVTAGFRERHVAGGTTVDVTVAFDESVEVSDSALDVEAVVVDPDDPALRARLGDDPRITVDPDFPLLVRILADPEDRPLARGDWEVELATPDLDFVQPTLRLFKAPDATSPFVDVTTTLGAGSYRAKATTGQMSDFLLVRDLRPADEVVDEKFPRTAGLIPPGPIFDPLRVLLQQARAAYDAGDYDTAIQRLDAFVAVVRDDARDGLIGDIWRGTDATLDNPAGQLSSAARTLQFSISRRAAGPPSGDLDGDGDTDVQDLFLLVEILFGV